MKLGTPAYALSVQQRAFGSPYHNNSALSLHAPMFLLLVFTTINYLVTFSVPVCMAAWFANICTQNGVPNLPKIWGGVP